MWQDEYTPDDFLVTMNAMRVQAMSIPSLLRFCQERYLQSVQECARNLSAHTIKNVIIVGEGEALLAAQAVQFSLSRALQVFVSTEITGTFISHSLDSIPDDLIKNTLVVAVSSGVKKERAAEALSLAREKKLTTLAITPEFGDVSLQADEVIIAQNPSLSCFNPDRVPILRTYVCQVVAMLLLAKYLGKHLAIGHSSFGRVLDSQLSQLPNSVRSFIQRNDLKIDALVERWVDVNEFVFVGAAVMRSAAEFCAAKIYEVSGDMAFVEEMHDWHNKGRYARNTKAPVVVLCSSEQELKPVTAVLENAQSRGNPVLLIAPFSVCKQLSRYPHLAFSDGVAFSLGVLYPSVFIALFAASRAEILGENFYREKFDTLPALETE